MKIFVTGTDTDVGKTVISAWLALHFGAYYYKPIQAGVEHLDLDVVRELNKKEKIVKSDYVLKLAASPHLAAREEVIHIDMDKMILPDVSPLIVEGAGGVMVPLNDDYMIIDLIKKFAIPVIIVSRSTLGTINHTCLTVEALRRRGIPVLGVIMNGPPSPHNKAAIEKYAKVRVVQEFPKLDFVDYESLKSLLPSEDLISVLNELG